MTGAGAPRSPPTGREPKGDSVPITSSSTEAGDLLRLARTLDDTAAWGDPPTLIGILQLPSHGGGGAVALASFPPGVPPADALGDVLAPAQWAGLGVIAEGWAYDLDGWAGRDRTRGERVRAVHIELRSGVAVGGFRVRGKHFCPTVFTTAAPCGGAIPVALRAALGVDGGAR